MTRPYSRDLRERAAARVLAGDSCRTVSKVFGISVASVVRWSQRLRQTGSAAAKPIGGRRRAPVLEGHRVWLLARIADKKDATLRGLMAEMAERGIEVSYGAVLRA